LTASNEDERETIERARVKMDGALPLLLLWVKQFTATQVSNGHTRVELEIVTAGEASVPASQAGWT